MDFTQLLLIIKARYKLVSIIFLFIVISTIVFNLNAPKRFESSTSLVLNYKGVDPVTGMTLPAQLMPGYMATQIDIINSKNVAIKVVKNLNLAESPVIKSQFYEQANGIGDINSWVANKILRNLDVRPSRESSVLEITYTSNDPDFSALVANAFADAYKETSIQLRVEPAKAVTVFLFEQIKSLKENLEAAQSKLSTYQKEHGLTSVNGSFDIEVGRLNELSTQLVLAQAQLYDSRSRKQSSSGNSNTSPDVASNPIVQNLRITVSRAETKLSELAQRYGPNHPEYLSAKAELEKQRSLLYKEIRNASGTISETKNINQQRESEIKAALAKQKERVLRLNLANNELSVIQTEVLNAQNALENASKRYSETVQESNSNQTDISLLNPAVAASSPVGPRVLLNIILSIFIGAIAAVLTGLFVEMLNKRVRSKEDLSRALEIPVFGLIKSRPKEEFKFMKFIPKQIAGKKG